MFLGRFLYASKRIDYLVPSRRPESRVLKYAVGRWPSEPGVFHRIWWRKGESDRWGVAIDQHVVALHVARSEMPRASTGVVLSLIV